TVNYTVTTGADCATKVTYGGTTVYSGGSATPTTTTAICDGGDVTVREYGGSGSPLQWQKSVNGGAWANVGSTGAIHMETGMTYPNTYKFRVLAQGVCEGNPTEEIVPQEDDYIPPPGVPTDYDFVSPTLALEKMIGLCSDNYTFTQRLANENAEIALGETVTVNFISGTDATTMTSGTFNGTAIDMGSVTSTATQITFDAPVAVEYTCPSEFTIVLNGITNPDYGSSGDATISVENATGGADEGTYPYETASHIGDYVYFDEATTWDYTTQNSFGHCYNNLAAGTYCFELHYPTSGSLYVGHLASAGTSGCSISSGSIVDAPDVLTSGCSNTSGNSDNVLYDNNCTNTGYNLLAGNCITAGSTYITCYTVPIGCDGISFCPLIDGLSVLPIDLLYFDAKMNEGVVELSWATATETNNDYFTLLKTSDTKVYFDFLKVNGAGNSISTLHYNAVDKNPFPGISYYRLQQTDYDGKYSLSRLVAINTNVKNKTLDITQPYFDGTTINTTAINIDNPTLTVEIIDFTGALVYYKTFETYKEKTMILKLPTYNLVKNSVYLMRIYNSKESVVRKFTF
ncbi:MAG: hypothetical protein PHD97_06605, partial [Bacteroidales bacterium]|nr:hypothetical protein [Bacteroidales bacterium]